MVGQHQLNHGLYDRYGAWHYARIVASFGRQYCGFTVLINCVLFFSNGSHWLKGYANLYGCAVAQSTDYPAGVVGCGFKIFCNGIVVGRVMT